jgi:hypothetical protein
MADNPEETATPAPQDYKSRPGALIWFFRKSRDQWKRKYQDLKAADKALKNRIADLTKSREQWKLKAEQASQRLAALEAALAELRAHAAAPEKKLGWQNSLDHYPGIGYDTRNCTLVEILRWLDGPPDPHPIASSTCRP